MLNKKKRNLAILIALFLTCSIFVLTISSNYDIRNEDIDYNISSLNISTIYSYTVINDILPGSTWEDAKSGGICTGSGTIGDPYLIEHDIFEYGSIGPGECLEIRNSQKYFILRNVTIRNADQNSRGLYLENVTNGLIDNCIVNNDAETGCTGIYMENVNNTEVRNSYIHDNTDNGLHLFDSHFNIISGNNISANTDVGIYLDQ
ncbi:MAG: right-handed parallel beta-helix repeat-containing protein, partial [Candidatus Hodarchaeota archaeon]